MDKTNVNQQNNRPSRKGVLNPMAGRHHSQETKNKMSQAAIKRNQEYKKLKDTKPMTMDEFLSNNPSVKEYINHLVKTQIDEMVWRKQNQ